MSRFKGTSRSSIRNGFTLALLLFAGGASPQTPKNVPVAQWDLARYQGRWHEIARLPLFFERHCVADITATYTLQPDGNLGVHNACRTAAGRQEQANGIARPVSERAGALKVTGFLGCGPTTGLSSWTPHTGGQSWAVRTASICGYCHARRR